MTPSTDQLEIQRNIPGAECRPGNEQMQPHRRPDALFIVMAGTMELGWGSTEDDAWTDASDRRREAKALHGRYALSASELRRFLIQVQSRMARGDLDGAAVILLGLLPNVEKRPIQEAGE